MARTFESFARIPLFGGLDAEEIRRLDTRCGWRRLPAGHWILDHGEAGTDVVFLAHGKARVLIRDVSGSDVILRDIAEGTYVGELAAIDGGPRSAGILAITDVVVARMPASVFREAIHRHPSVADGVLAGLAARVRALALRVDESARLGAGERVLAELVRLSRPGRGPDEGLAVVSPPPTHGELAARIGVRRETVAREFGRLAREGRLRKRTGALIVDLGAREEGSGAD